MKIGTQDHLRLPLIKSPIPFFLQVANACRQTPEVITLIKLAGIV